VYALGDSPAAGRLTFRRQPIQPVADKAGPSPAPLPCYSIDEKVQVLGGETGILGRARSEEIDLGSASNTPGGKMRFFEGAEKVAATCYMPEDFEIAPVLTAVYWSEKTCAHALQGAALELWESLGGELSPLGYPVTDEVPTRDGAGRHIVFEHG